MPDVSRHLPTPATWRSLITGLSGLCCTLTEEPTQGSHPQRAGLAPAPAAAASCAHSAASTPSTRSAAVSAAPPLPARPPPPPPPRPPPPPPPSSGSSASVSCAATAASAALAPPARRSSTASARSASARDGPSRAPCAHAPGLVLSRGRFLTSPLVNQCVYLPAAMLCVTCAQQVRSRPTHDHLCSFFAVRVPSEALQVLQSAVTSFTSAMSD